MVLEICICIGFFVFFLTIVRNDRNDYRFPVLSSRQTTCGEICFCINEWFILVVTLVRLQISHIQFEMTDTVTDFSHPVWNDNTKQKRLPVIDSLFKALLHNNLIHVVNLLLTSVNCLHGLVIGRSCPQVDWSIVRCPVDQFGHLDV